MIFDGVVIPVFAGFRNELLELEETVPRYVFVCVCKCESVCDESEGRRCLPTSTSTTIIPGKNRKGG